MATKQVKQHKLDHIRSLRHLTENILQEEAILKEGGGQAGQERQQRLGRLTARERLRFLLDDIDSFFELGIWAGYQMYTEWGELPAAGVITGIGKVLNRPCMIIANDATVKAGAMFPQSVKKVLRAQRIAFECRLPIIYLVDSSGVFLPLQAEIFPDEDDFGRIFRNNAILSAAAVPQFAAIMGNCIAGGGYLPVLCDKLLMTKGSGLYLAGPALVKAAIGQVVDPEELGGADMHAAISGTVDFLEPNDHACLERLRQLTDLLPSPKIFSESLPIGETEYEPLELYDLVSGDNQTSYSTHVLMNCIVDKGSLIEYKSEYGKSLVTAFAKIQGMPVGIIANQREQTTNGRGEIEIGGVIYAKSADKAARFIMDCNQTRTPLIFLQDVVGFMVGKEAEQSGIIRSGAKLVNAISNSIVPKITIIVGNSFGAGNYALCGKAYDPNFILAWPNAKYAVMGADQAANTLFTIQKQAAERKGTPMDSEEAEKLRQKIKQVYDIQMDIRYGAARGWVDAIIPPHATRSVLIDLLHLVNEAPQLPKTFHTGVFQV
ncbi:MULTISPECIES: acyl-CoA carboxylase subunit beta [Parachlamydia]|uniref:acyl-CoA carboxylase subunit beta n=1 Tax=Parachlamydia TaxID=83551 RepID=UPI0024E217D6|nr:acyl-CoA carboxylase subunit beta [Parachlamydia acanthamoebae]